VSFTETDNIYITLCRVLMRVENYIRELKT